MRNCQMRFLRKVEEFLRKVIKNHLFLPVPYCVYQKKAVPLHPQRFLTDKNEI